MISDRKMQIEFGDFQTPLQLAIAVCNRLLKEGVRPQTIIEPTCGKGAFVLAAAATFRECKNIVGFDVNTEYLNDLKTALVGSEFQHRIHLTACDFFKYEWDRTVLANRGPILVLGNFPWVNNSTQSMIGGVNLPVKSNFLRHSGLDAITGKSNFDISEWMLIEVLSWFSSRAGTIAMLVKTAVARKIIEYARNQSIRIAYAEVVRIDAKKHFNAAVDACLLIISISDGKIVSNYDFNIYSSLSDEVGNRVGQRDGLQVHDLEKYESGCSLLGTSPEKWRSGVKHDASDIMELSKCGTGFKNGLGEFVDIESSFVYPLMKGSHVGTGKNWLDKYVLITQRFVGEDTKKIEQLAPKTWAYLMRHSRKLDNRASVIYAGKPAFSIFGVGEYAFRPWRVAICGLYKHLRFRLVPPIEESPVMFDDTVYYLSFNTQVEAQHALDCLNSDRAQGVLGALIFWEDKRPVKTGILNRLDWTKVSAERNGPNDQPVFGVSATRLKNATQVK